MIAVTTASKCVRWCVLSTGTLYAAIKGCTQEYSRVAGVGEAAGLPACWLI